MISTIGLAATTVYSAPALAAASLPQPFAATYAVSFRGLSGGTLRMNWRRDESNGHYVFETRANPSTLAKLFVSAEAFERTTLELTPDGIRPVAWEANDGKSGEKGDGKLEFNWTDMTVTGAYEGKPVSLPLETGVMDRLSIQIGAMTALLSGREPGSIAIINGDSERTTHTPAARPIRSSRSWATSRL